MKIILISSFFLFLLSFFSYRKLFNFIILIIMVIIYCSLPELDNFSRFFLLFLILNSSMILTYNKLNLEFDPNTLLILNLISTFLIILSNNLFLLYLLIEIQTFSLFILIGKNKKSIKSIEAALKYFLMGGLSSGLFLLGLVFLYKNNINLDITNFNSLDLNNLGSKLSYLSINLSIIFKLALFPLQFWISDIYEGVNLNILLILSTLPKISLIVIILKIINNNSFYLSFSFFSIIIGSLGAFNQTKINRLIAYSGVANIGFIILSMNLLNSFGFESSLVYIIVYFFTLSSLIIILSSSKNKFIIFLNNSWFNIKPIGLVIVILILSLSGLPPLLGFFSKWLVFLSLVESGKLFLSRSIILMTSLSVGFYLRLVKIIFFHNNSSLVKFERILSKPKFLNYNIYIMINFIFIMNIILMLNPNIISLLSSWSLIN